MKECIHGSTVTITTRVCAAKRQYEDIRAGETMNTDGRRGTAPLTLPIVAY